MLDIFSQRFKPKEIFDNPPEEKLREWALDQGVVTEFGNLSVNTAVRNRIAKFTEAVRGELNEGNAELVSQALGYLRGKEIINAIGAA